MAGSILAEDCPLPTHCVPCSMCGAMLMVKAIGTIHKIRMPIPTNVRGSLLFWETTHRIMVALKEVIMATMMIATVPLLLIAWGQVWVGVVAVASAMALDMDHHLLSTVLTLTPQFLWYMALSPQRSMLTRSSTSSASTVM